MKVSARTILVADKLRGVVFGDVVGIFSPADDLHEVARLSQPSSPPPSRCVLHFSVQQQGSLAELAKWLT